MRTLAAVLLFALPACALAQVTPQPQGALNLPWPTESAGQPYAGPMGAYLNGPQLPSLVTTPGAAGAATPGGLGNPLAATPGFMGLSAAASDAVTLGWGSSANWAGSAGLPNWGAGGSVWAPNPLWSAPQQGIQGPDLSAARWSAAGLNPWLSAAPSAPQAVANPWTSVGASPWLSAGEGALAGSTAGLGTGDIGLGAATWLASPAAAASGAQLPNNVGTGAAPSGLSLGPSASALSPNPWVTTNPLEPLTPAAGQTALDLGAAPSPWTSLSGATGLGGLQPQATAPTGAFDPSGQFTTPGLPGLGGLQASPWLTPAAAPLSGPATPAPLAGPVWQAAPQAPTSGAAWGSGNPVLTLDGQSWQVVAPSALPDGSPATTQSLMDQAREAGFQLVPVAPQPSTPGGLEPPAAPAQ